MHSTGVVFVGLSACLLGAGTASAAHMGWDFGAAKRASTSATDSAPDVGRWRLTTKMHVSRTQHAGILLADGRVLVTGGWSAPAGGVSTGAIASAEFYDPAAGTWHEAPPMGTPRSAHHAVRLVDGKVLVVGGLGGSPEVSALASVEIFDPVGGTWSQAKPMDTPRWGGTVSVLPDGTVLIAGGTDLWIRGMQDPTLRSVERFDPATGNWIPTDDLSVGRAGHSAPVLAATRTGRRLAGRSSPSITPKTSH
jgi:hypothetical protein